MSLMGNTLFVYLLTALVSTQRQVTFTDVRQNKRVVADIIARITTSTQNPVECLKSCMTNSVKCKSINFNKELKSCELLGASLNTDNGLEIEINEGWTYYGPKNYDFEVYEDCHKHRFVDGKEICCAGGKRGPNCQNQTLWCADKYHGLCHSSSNEVQTNDKTSLGIFPSTNQCFKACKSHIKRNYQTVWTACEANEILQGYECHIFSSYVRYGKETNKVGLYYASCWILRKCLERSHTTSCHFAKLKFHSDEGHILADTVTKSYRFNCKKHCITLRRTTNSSINAVKYNPQNNKCSCMILVGNGDSTFKVGDKRESCVIRDEDWGVKHAEGLSADSPGISCQQLKHRHPEYQSGYYWVFYKQESTQVFCKMTDNEGWMMIGHWKLDANSDNNANTYDLIKASAENMPLDITEKNRAYGLRTLSRFHVANELTEIRIVCSKPSHGRKIDLIIKNERYFMKSFQLL
eukprot:TCONS_00025643-protein